MVLLSFHNFWLKINDHSSLFFKNLNSHSGWPDWVNFFNY
jgi:hypothetical protein